LIRRVGERGNGRGTGRSLRSELILNLAALAAAALVLGVWTVLLFQQLPLEGARYYWALSALLVADVAIFVLLGNYLVDRFVLRPVRSTVEVAEAVAGGDFDRRAPAGDTQEMATLAGALNHLTEQLLANQDKLTENVASLDETNRRLVDAQRELLQAEKLASIGGLAAGVAHEVGNPLGSIFGYVAVLRRRGVDEEVLGAVEREAGRIDRIVRSLLDYARPPEEHRAPVEVNTAIEDVLLMLREQGTLGGVAVDATLYPGPTTVLGSRHRIDQLFVNLFENAVQAMDGAGRLVVRTHAEEYRGPGPSPAQREGDPPGTDYTHLRTERQVNARNADRLRAGTRVIRVVVADSGPGVAPDHLERIFDPFFTTKEPGEGTGLGLAIVASAVAEIGGRIEASSPDAGGAAFTILIPAHEPG
jgi:two-component system, NtrC family, sensor kinase